MIRARHAQLDSSLRSGAKVKGLVSNLAAAEDYDYGEIALSYNPGGQSFFWEVFLSNPAEESSPAKLHIQRALDISPDLCVLADSFDDGLD